MSKSLLILVTLLAFNQVVQGQNTTNSTDQINMNFYAACARGSLQGFEQGLYNNQTFKVSDKCLGQSQISQAYKLYQAYMTGSIINIFQTVSTSYQLLFMLDKTCNTEQVLYDISTWCGKADCSIPTIFNNVVKRFFQITGAINNIAEQALVDSPPITNTTAYFSKYANAGNSVGKIFRIVFDYQ